MGLVDGRLWVMQHSLLQVWVCVLYYLQIQRLLTSLCCVYLYFFGFPHIVTPLSTPPYNLAEALYIERQSWLTGATESHLQSLSQVRQAESFFKCLHENNCARTGLGLGR